MRDYGSNEDRFWPKVDKSGDCWEWLAAKTEKGYGVFTKTPRTYIRAHRMAWELERGPIPEGMTIDHLCYNEGCVNVDHMEVVSLQENLARRRVINNQYTARQA